MKTTVTKRDGHVVEFNLYKIISAIEKANNSVDEKYRLTQSAIIAISRSVSKKCSKHESISVEEIQDTVECALMKYGAYNVAKNYVKYRYTRSLIRQSNTTDESILKLVNLNNQDANDENSNKNPIINSTQRDYIAGYVSRDITDRILLPKEISEAHKKGIIHFHDSDYFIIVS